ncbi:hypothetical protein B0H14DRAFT_2664443 [Mycena olivaceomarginata]|nr:hypothetical protein B0H14DRAFT_2664443 [Mycena olivaceomarginata]
MAELIRRVSARPGSPFPVVARRGSLGGGAGSNPGTPTTTYSPHHKFSRSALSRIAPLHPNRRTPPPPLPPPPPKPKTKKEKEREERWEEEMIEALYHVHRDRIGAEWAALHVDLLVPWPIRHQPTHGRRGIRFCPTLRRHLRIRQVFPSPFRTCSHHH